MVNLLLPLRLLIRCRILLLLVLLLVASLAIQGVGYFRRYEENRAREYQASLELARSIAATYDAYTQDILRQELAIGLALTASPAPSTEEANRLLTITARQYPSILDYGWVSPQGRAVASSNPAAIGVDISDRPYFRRVAEEGRDWAVSDLLTGRVGGKPGIFVVRGIRDDQGTLLGVAFAAVDPARLAEVLGVQRSNHGAVALVDTRGALVYRSPSVEMTDEQRERLRSMPVIAPALAGEEVAATAVSVVDGERRMISAAPVRSLGWAVTASRSEAEVMAPVIKDLLMDVVLTLLVMVVAILPALFIARSITAPLGRLHEQAQALAWGDLKRRVEVRGSPELQRLAEGFNRMAEELEQHERQRAMYLHMVSHDLRAPLTVILGRIQMLLRLLRKAGLTGPERDNAEAALTSAQRMDAMIQELVDSARLETGQLQLQMQPLDLSALLRDLRERLASLPGGDRIVISGAPPPAPVRADPDRLERIMTNLLTNAIKYSEPATEITVTVTAGDREVVVTVRDRGPGIAPEELPKLFREYHRAPAAQETSEGLGLGLYITKKLVEAHGGRIWAESVAGEGSAFSVALPRNGAAPQQGDPPGRLTA